MIPEQTRRPPTYDEFSERVRTVSLWAALLTYCLAAAVLGWAMHVILPRAWFEILMVAAWAPPGFCAWYVKAKVEGWMLRWVPIES